MTAREAFEAWWKTNVNPSIQQDIRRLGAAKASWLAACAWQTERDAKIAEGKEHHSHGHCCAQGIATAIRGGTG